jgi:hypothetical protein
MQKILVVCAFCDRDQHWKAPAGFDLNEAELVLCNYENPAQSLLKPYETRVYLWKK